MLSSYRSLFRESLRLSRSQCHSGQGQCTNFLKPQLRVMSNEVQDPSVFERHAKDAITFLKAQREYSELLERYNPTHGMTTEERTTATARRVGLNMPNSKME